MRKAAISIIGFLALAGVIGYLATSGGGTFRSADNGGGGAASEPLAAASRAPGLGGDTAAGASVEGPTKSSANVGAVPAIGPAVVKTAQLEVQVAKDGFMAAFGSAGTIAAKYGGYVQSSSTSGTKVHSGSLTIRVPAASFENAMSDLGELGTVKAQSMSGTDVTSQYVDLHARLITWQAQEKVLLRLMRRSTSVEATLRVQQQLQDVQFRIEQLKGQLRVLQDQTSLATIQLELREPGAPISTPRTVSERPSLGEAWDKALNGFFSVVYSVTVGLGYLIPIALIVALGWLGYRRIRPRPVTSS